MMFLNKPNDWYFVVGADQSQVYYTASGSFVPVTNATYVAWKKNNTPFLVDSIASLAAILAPNLIRPIDVSVLDAYQDYLASDLSSKIVYKVIFNLLKRVAVLEGKPAPTAAQAVAFSKSLM